jgi:HK97 family phage prohead protease
MFKNATVQVKAAGPDDGLEDGQFKALVSVFNNVDSVGDKVMPGAFTKTLAEWEESGNPIPVYWSHRLDDPDMNIGYVIEAAETNDGLEVLGQLDLDAEASPKAKQAYRLLKGRRTTQWSFAYDVIDSTDGDGFTALNELKLYEVSTTPIGANQSTETLAVKHDGAATVTLDGQKLGRTLSGKNEDTLRAAVDSLESAAKAIKSVLAAIDSSGSDDGKTSTTSTASDTGPVKDEEPAAAKSEEPIRRTSAATWEAHINLSELERTYDHASD